MSNKPNLRADTALVIHGVLGQGKSLRELLPDAQKHHQPNDKAWMHEMVLGVMRQLPLLRYWLDALLDKPLANKNKRVESLLLLGLYQLAFSRVPGHAAVAETVNAVQRLKAPSMKGLVNAVLRNFNRRDLANQTQHIEPLRLQQQLTSGLPDWLYGKLAKAHPDNMPSIVEQIKHKPPLWLRVNRAQTTPENIQTALREKGISAVTSPQHSSETLILESPQRITELPGYEAGWFAVQDGAAQLAALYLDPQPQDRVLDACAAPGGKTGHLLEKQPDLSEVVALDADPSRLDRVSENLDRLQHNATLICGDATSPDKWWDGQPFDRILLDAPCSATGVIRRHPDIKWLRRPEDIPALVQLQEKILHSLWKLLKPGGVLLYATCSVLPEENTRQIKSFLSLYRDAKPVPLSATEAAMERQILPGEAGMDGFFYAKLMKTE